MDSGNDQGLFSPVKLYVCSFSSLSCAWYSNQQPIHTIVFICAALLVFYCAVSQICKQSTRLYTDSKSTFIKCTRRVPPLKSCNVKGFSELRWHDNVQITLCHWLYSSLVVLFFSLPLPDWQTDFHKHHMAAISSVKFDSLLKMSPHFYGCKSHMAAFVLTSGKGHMSFSDIVWILLSPYAFLSESL